MSSQIKEFIDIPQQFVRDGNQVSPFCATSIEAGLLNVERSLAPI